MGPSPNWLPTLLGSILNERRHPGPSGHPPYPVLSKRGGNILDRAAFPLVWFYAKGGVTSRIMGPPPRSGAIQNEGGIPVHDASPLSGSVLNERCHPESWAPAPSGPIQNEGWHPGSTGSALYLVPSKVFLHFPLVYQCFPNERG